MIGVEGGASPARRALTQSERQYLEERRDRIAAALKALWLVIGFLSLPVLFLTSSASATGDRLAWCLAGLIVSALVVLMLNYSAKEARHPRLGWQDWQVPQQLDEDLRISEVVRLSGVVTNKGEGHLGPAWFNGWGLLASLAGQDPRRSRFWVEVDARRLEVSAGRYFETAVGDRLDIDLAPRSHVVLSVNDAPQRLSLFKRDQAE